jgi:chromosome partitioning protein
MHSESHMAQIVIAILANAGGVGKSTLAAHLACELVARKCHVAMLDLDPQRSLDVFCGLEAVDANKTTANVLSKDFKGDWQLTPVWDELKVEVCQGHPTLAEVANDLVIRKRGEYVLADRLKKYPLPHDVVILDCPATLGMLNVNALAAATHLLIPIQLEMKAIAGSAELVEWSITTSEELHLDPRPPILGFVPSMYDDSVGMHRQYLKQLPEIAQQLEIKLYPEIRTSNEFKNASAHGLPLHKYRPRHPACKDFKQVVDDVVRLIKANKDK